MQLETLSIVLPTSWKIIPDDSMPQAADMTARYQIRTSAGDTIFLVHGFSAWDLSSDDSADYRRERDMLFGRRAMMFRTKSEIDNIIGVFVDSVGEVKPVGYYGFTAYAKRLQNNVVDSFWNVIWSIKLRSL